MNYVHLGACIGDWDNKCGFTKFIKTNCSTDDKIFLIEANPKNIIKLKKSYKNFKNAKIFNLGVSIKKNKKSSFFFTEDDAPHYKICSLNRDHVLKHYPNSIIKKFEIDTITINNLFKNYIKEKNIDFLSIDIEGIDYEVLTAINLNKYNIQNISIEHLHLTKIQKKNLLKYLEINGYSYCGFGYDHNNFDFLFKKKKIFFNRMFAKLLTIISKKHLHILNFFIFKN